jgi:hypothetical protein
MAWARAKDSDVAALEKEGSITTYSARTYLVEDQPDERRPGDTTSKVALIQHGHALDSRHLPLREQTHLQSSIQNISLILIQSLAINVRMYLYHLITGQLAHGVWSHDLGSAPETPRAAAKATASRPTDGGCHVTSKVQGPGRNIFD